MDDDIMSLLEDIKELNINLDDELYNVVRSSLEDIKNLLEGCAGG